MKTGIDDEDLRERLRQILGLAREVDHLLHRPERRHGDEIRLHQAAGGLLGIEQVALQGGAVALRHLIEDFLLVVRLEAFEKVGRVVAVELADAAGEDVVRQGLGELVANLLVDLGEHLEVEIGSQRLNEPDALLGLEQLDEIGQIGILARRPPANAPSPYRLPRAPAATARTSSAGVAASGSCAPICSVSVMTGALSRAAGGAGRRPAKENCITRVMPCA